MKKALLDTNFIMTCVKQKIDFFEDLKLMGFNILIPEQVINELEKNKAKLALSILKNNSFKKIDIKNGHVDKRILEYVKDKPEILVATLDQEIKDKIPNNKIIIQEKKRLAII